MRSQASFILLNGKYVIFIDETDPILRRERKGIYNFKRMFIISLHYLRYFSNKNKKKNAKLLCGNKLTRFQYKHKESSFNY